MTCRPRVQQSNSLAGACPHTQTGEHTRTCFWPWCQCVGSVPAAAGDWVAKTDWCSCSTVLATTETSSRAYSARHTVLQTTAFSLFPPFTQL